MAIPIDARYLDADSKLFLSEELRIVPTLGLTEFEESRAAQSKCPPKPAEPFHFFLTDGDELRIPRHFFHQHFSAETVEQTHRPLPPTKPAVAVRDHQRSILEEAMAALQSTGACSIEVPPGTGKTFMALMLAGELGLQTAILTPRTTISHQWVESIGRVFGDQCSHYEIPAASAVKKNHAEKMKSDILISLGTRSGTAATFSQLAGVGTLIIDEAHMVCTASWVASILSYSPKYIIALTATLERKDGAQTMIRHLIGEASVVRTPEREYCVHRVDTSVCVPEVINPVTERMDYTKFISALAASEEYNQAICDIVLTHPDQKFIVLFKLADHARHISEKLTASGVKSALMIRSLKSYVDCRVLCGTFGKISTGFDAQTFSSQFDGVQPDAVIFANTVKTWQSFEQSAGRGKRAGDGVVPAIYWMTTRNSITKSHLAGLKPYIQKTNGRIEPYGSQTVAKKHSHSDRDSGRVARPIARAAARAREARAEAEKDDRGDAAGGRLESVDRRQTR